MANAAASAMFRVLACIDAVGDPVDYAGDWPGLVLQPRPDDEEREMLHDAFYETYWRWRRKIRVDPGRRLDSGTDGH